MSSVSFSAVQSLGLAPPRHPQPNVASVISQTAITFIVSLNLQTNVDLTIPFLLVCIFLPSLFWPCTLQFSQRQPQPKEKVCKLHSSWRLRPRPVAAAATAPLPSGPCLLPASAPSSHPAHQKKAEKHEIEGDRTAKARLPTPLCTLPPCPGQTCRSTFHFLVSCRHLALDHACNQSHPRR
jgi:hypothetical protein